MLAFDQFLKEAKTHSTEANFDAATPHSSEEAGKKQFGGGQKSKKSWRKSLFSWLKTEKKCKPMPIPEEEPSNKPYNISKPRRSYLSGPINGSGSYKIDRPRRPNSGPLMVFNSTKRMEDKMPYVCLDQLNSPRVVQSYGPVYLVS